MLDKRGSKRADRMFPSGVSGLYESRSEVRKRASCLGKEKFTDPSKARDVMVRVVSKIKGRGLMKVYHCEYCRHYHFGESGW